MFDDGEKRKNIIGRIESKKKKKVYYQTSDPICHPIMEVVCQGESRFLSFLVHRIMSLSVKTEVKFSKDRGSM